MGCLNLENTRTATKNHYLIKEIFLRVKEGKREACALGGEIKRERTNLNSDFNNKTPLNEPAIFFLHRLIEMLKESVFASRRAQEYDNYIILL